MFRRVIVLTITACAFLQCYDYYASGRQYGTGRGRFPPGKVTSIDLFGTTWTQVMNWDFSDGFYPRGWGWGEWRIENGYLTGWETEDKFAVYFLPFIHGSNVILETKARFLGSSDEHHAEVHLLTRDGRAVHSESGMVVVEGENRVDVRHMQGMVQNIRGSHPTRNPISGEQWYVLRFILQGEKVDAYVDGELVFSSDHHGVPVNGSNGVNGTNRMHPQVVYREPHLAVKYGTAQFEYVTIFEDRSAPQVSAVRENAPLPPGPPGGNERHWLVTVIIWIFSAVILVLCVYTIRHYAFTLNRLFGRQRQPYLDVDTARWPEVTAVIPAHNEEVVIGEILEALLDVDYPTSKLHILPVDDRSKDSTGEIIDDFARRYPGRITSYHREGGTPGKAAVLNEILEKVRTEIVLIFDADYIPGRGLIKQLVAPFFDPEVGAVMGRVVPYNVGSNLLTRLLDLERAGGYQVDQQARMNLKMVPQFGGTVGGIRRRALLSVGGWREDSLAEDTDATYRLLLGGWKTVYQNRSECYEQVPETWASRIRQIMRWAKGHNQATARFGLSLLRNHRIRWIEKIDGFLLLGVYLISPILVVGWTLGIALWFMGEPHADLVTVLFVTSYITLGNFAAFYEITAAVQLDGARERIRLLPFVFFGFIISLFSISRVAFAHIGMNENGKNGRNNSVVWDKTERDTSFNGYTNGRKNSGAGNANPSGDDLRSYLLQETPLPDDIVTKISAPRLYAMLGDAYRAKGELNKAVQILEQGIAESPGYVTAYYILARSLAQKGERARALKEYEQALDLDAHHAAAMKGIAGLLLDMGRKSKARNFIAKYLEEVPADEDARKWLAGIDSAFSSHRSYGVTKEPDHDD